MKKFFIEGNEYSMMRLLSFLSIATAIISSGFLIMFVYLKTNPEYIRELLLLIGTLLGFGFGGKVIQKYGETKNNV